ncbi:MAG: hypothetical protein JWP09_698, partial [Candidatus Taylorbacteria bacterium]|nr:hypothetical protein [Candidatus Taylorbacteria bacterium]
RRDIMKKNTGIPVFFFIISLRESAKRTFVEESKGTAMF